MVRLGNRRQVLQNLTAIPGQCCPRPARGRAYLCVAGEEAPAPARQCSSTAGNIGFVVEQQRIKIELVIIQGLRGYNIQCHDLLSQLPVQVEVQRLVQPVHAGLGLVTCTRRQQATQATVKIRGRGGLALLQQLIRQLLKVELGHLAP